MDNCLTTEQQNALIEDVLKSQSLARMPHDLTASVMARIQVSERPALITWNDFAVALVIVLTIGTLFITARYLPPIALMKIRIQGILLYQTLILNAYWLVPALLFGVAALFAGFSIPLLLKMTADDGR